MAVISVGMPVFNGERFLAAAIASILNQTETDLELIICDNASTDATRSIATAAARSDPRIRYVRNDANIGAGPNYDKCFSLATGEFFKWHAHDDLVAPDFIEKAIAALRADPAAVLWSSNVQIIDESGNSLGLVVDDIAGSDSDRPSRRFAAMLTDHRCTSFFGVFRRSALEGTQLHGSFIDSDRVLLAEIALRGKILCFREPLFFNREHASRYTASIAKQAFASRREASRWLDSRNSSRKMHLWIRFIAYVAIVWKWVPDIRERLACYGELRRWLFEPFHLRDLAKEIVWVVSPDFLLRASRAKRSAIGPRDARVKGDPTSKVRRGST